MIIHLLISNIVKKKPEVFFEGEEYIKLLLFFRSSKLDVRVMLLNNLSKRALVNERCILQKIKCVSKRNHQKAAMVILRSYHVKKSSVVSCHNNTSNKFKNTIEINNAPKLYTNFPNSYMQVRFYTLPPYNKILLPALSPTMEMGTIVQWQVKEGDHFEPGDLLADIETDKATMGFEAIEEGYIAKILVKDGSKDVPLGTLVAIFVENKDDLEAFKNVTAGIIYYNLFLKLHEFSFLKSKLIIFPM